MATPKDKDAPEVPTAPVTPAAPVNPLIEASNIPTVDASPREQSTEFTRPDISEYKGLYFRSDDPNQEPFALAIKEGEPNGKTHFLLNTANSDNCTKEEFKQRYEKSDKK